jgi:hypothetical protein
VIDFVRIRVPSSVALHFSGSGKSSSLVGILPLCVFRIDPIYRATQPNLNYVKFMFYR